uniref:Eukaryotic translation initiation factor 3 subunit L n=1 Tax=Chromera velia CCMP2878 TaxID=1169474 RepID=A0A0G4HRD1_9ALVE|mmetsp:Transcript_16270/g.32980  ORF Transcript_16270/g.32980 Transcript_16270/m.32980 type:complete len:718 (-) Transcript_16270:581-2734(-)|eukprot:Cvel_8104.t1-p1 / transcript=Cvel_8104.t1 / gene=Cvel_8104 / organism=Chromera_velia_CCMP2878 / gene_product=Eukaryotic translation initiation factor 3 subunit, putative / transcript_product=Eukaryotic translation initiation factor 3 subunit, putative / location=Cvel_scaffold440:82364-88528(+) / protein_length=717 / sequence_SO=supercontig / SO=protein_coding / is_pseudo=false
MYDDRVLEDQMEAMEEAAASVAIQNMSHARRRAGTDDDEGDDEDNRAPMRRDSDDEGEDGPGGAPRGDQMMDRDDERHQAKKAFLPPPVSGFLRDLYDHVLSRNVEELRILYEQTFNKLTNKFFRSTRWPSIATVEDFYAEQGMDEGLVITLYKELFWRHIYSRLSHQLTWQDRISSWNNYQDLIEFLVDYEAGGESENPITLPSSWVWDILDEFIYQFQTFQIWRQKTVKALALEAKQEESFEQDRAERRRAKRADLTARKEAGEEIDDREWPDSEEEERNERERFRNRAVRKFKGAELDTLLERSDVWNYERVLEFLDQLAERSQIREILRECKKNPNETERYAEFGHSLRHMLGYFALICTLRVKSMLGDFDGALECIDEVELMPRAFYVRVPPCHITLMYYLSFAYFMLRRYHDCARILQTVLHFVQRSRNYLGSESYQYDAMVKTTDRMFHILVLCISMSPVAIRLEESVHQVIRQEKLQEKMERMRRDDESTYQDVFSFACPKFILVTLPDDEALQEPEKLNPNAAVHAHIRTFLQEMKQMKLIANFRSYAKLYNSIALSKLASLMNRSEEQVKEMLAIVKEKSRQVVWKGGPPASGEVQVLTDVDFVVEGSMLHVEQVRAQKQRSYVEPFTKQILRIQEVTNQLQRSLQKGGAGDDKGPRGGRFDRHAQNEGAGAGASAMWTDLLPKMALGGAPPAEVLGGAAGTAAPRA